MEKTTIQISQKTLDRLRALKKYEKESYEEIVNTLIDDIEEELTPEEIEEVELALKEIKKRGVEKTTTPIEEVAKELNVRLEK
jgi:hypothetical protein